MAILDKYLNRHTEKALHPFIIACQCLVDEGFSVQSVRFRRDRKLLPFEEPRLFVQFKKGSETRDVDNAWHADVERWLFKHGGRAVSKDNEKERMGYYLRFLFQQGPYDLGEGYIDLALVERLHKEFGRKPQIKKALKSVPVPRQTGRGHYYEMAMRFLDQSFTEIATRLKFDLGYEEADVEGIFIGALAYFLDDRFWISSRSLFASSR